MTELQKIKTHIARPEILKRKRHSLFKIIPRELIYPPFYWFLAYRHHVPGLHIQALIYFLGLRLLARGKIRFVASRKLLSSPMDSVRYFEFDFFYRCFSNHSVFNTYLDVSSPRLFPALVMQKFPKIKVTMVNPDIKDLNITKELFSACRFENRCTFFGTSIDNLNLPRETFNIITSISVIEHIPADGDLAALKKMWNLLKPNGKLLLSVPCAHTAFEEYIDFNEYDLLTPDKDSYVYGQRFYDKKILQDRFWSITGPPVNAAVYGEKREGFFMNNRQERLISSNYPFWREPYMMGLNYRKYDSIDDLPGVGVIALEFSK